VQLSHFAEVTTGHGFRRRITAQPGGGCYVIQMKDVTPALTIDWHSVTETAVQGRRPNYLIKGDILVAGRGNHNYAVLIEPIERPLVAAPYFFVVRNHRPDMVLPAYIAWLLNAGPAQAWFKQSALGAKSKHLRINTVKQAPVFSLPLHDQHRLLAIDSNLFALQQHYQHLMALDNTLRKHLATQLFSARYFTRLHSFLALRTQRDRYFAELESLITDSQLLLDELAATDSVRESTAAYHQDIHRPPFSSRLSHYKPPVTRMSSLFVS